MSKKKTCVNKGEECLHNYECKRKKGIEKILLVVILLLLGGFIGGVVVGGLSLIKDVKKDVCEKSEANTQQTIDNSKLFENGFEIFSYKKFPYDDISLETEEDIEEFVNVMRMDTSGMDSYKKIRNEFFNNSKEKEGLLLLQQAYVLQAMFGNIAESMGPVVIDADVIKNEIKKVFVIEDDIILESLDFLDVFIGYQFPVLHCIEETCIAVVGQGGAGVCNPYYETKIVDSRKEQTNTIYTLDDFYYVPVPAEDENSRCSYKETKVGTYEMTFDKDNRYVGSIKIS